MNIIQTDRGTYDLSQRYDVYRYFCQNFGLKGDDLSLLEKFLLNGATKKLKWVKPSKENLPPEELPILIKCSYGIMSGFWDRDAYLESSIFNFTTDVLTNNGWKKIEGCIEEFISMDAFNSVFEHSK